MKTLHKLLVGLLLVALTAFGLTALTSSSNDPATRASLWFYRQVLSKPRLQVV